MMGDTVKNHESSQVVTCSQLLRYRVCKGLP
jgi:hypothetical protein